jgi:hypothetical protein
MKPYLHLFNSSRQAMFSQPAAEPPNPSFERTPTGKPRWPRSGVVHHPLRGQRVLPPVAAQLKR